MSDRVKDHDLVAPAVAIALVGFCILGLGISVVLYPVFRHFVKGFKPGLQRPELSVLLGV